MSFEHELDVARNLAIEAGKVLRRYQAGPIQVDHKAHGEIVTPADRQSDALIHAGLQAAFPEDAVFSEETADSPERLTRARVWIVDPLDSTSNYSKHGDEYSVSIGLALRGRPVLGVVYNPAPDDLVAGGSGLGVTRNGSPVRTSNVARIEEAHILVSSKEWERGLDTLAASLPIRPMASMASKLARVAAGLDDGVFSAKPRKEWGTCAGVALVLAAGGRATLLDGSEIGFNRQEPRQPMGFVAAGYRLHPILLDSVRRLLNERGLPR